jgi:hypothetical protein
VCTCAERNLWNDPPFKESESVLPVASSGPAVTGCPRPETVASKSLFAPHAFEFFALFLTAMNSPEVLSRLVQAAFAITLPLSCVRLLTAPYARSFAAMPAKRRRAVGLDLDRRRFKTGQIIQTSSREKLVSTLAASTLSREELPYRLRQQSLLGEFGR